MSSTIAALGEFALIERLRRQVGPPPPGVEIGIGDDAAVLVPERGAVEVVTTDSQVEGVHFRRDWTAPSAIGYKALAVNLSDLAAMGAAPRASLLSLVLPASLLVVDFDQLIEGFVALSRESNATLVGGNIARSPGPLIIDVTAIGTARRRRVLRRDRARDGDELYVTGTVGAARAGLEMRAAGFSPDANDDASRACLERFERPDARWRCGMIVGRTGTASAAMDLSDGLGAAARSLADANGLRLTLDAASIPVHEGARIWAERRGEDPVASTLAGGEDYELAFAVSPRARSRFLAAMRRCRGLAATRVGRFTKGHGAWLDRNGQVEPIHEGFAHFHV